MYESIKWHLDQQAKGKECPHCGIHKGYPQLAEQLLAERDALRTEVERFKVWEAEVDKAAKADGFKEGWWETMKENQDLKAHRDKLRGCLEKLLSNLKELGEHCAERGKTRSWHQGWEAGIWRATNEVATALAEVGGEE